MKKTGLVVAALTAVVALSGCTGRYYDRDYRYYGDSRYDRYDSAVPGSGVYYTDRTPGNPYYTDYPNREYRDRDASRLDRYDD